MIYETQGHGHSAEYLTGYEEAKKDMLLALSPGKQIEVGELKKRIKTLFSMRNAL